MFDDLFSFKHLTENPYQKEVTSKKIKLSENICLGIYCCNIFIIVKCIQKFNYVLFIEFYLFNKYINVIWFTFNRDVLNYCPRTYEALWPRVFGRFDILLFFIL